MKALDTAMERIGTADSLTVRIVATLTQNDVTRLTADVICQADRESEYLHATLMDNEGNARNVEITSSDGKRVIRDGDDCYAMPETWQNEAAESAILPEAMTVSRLYKDLKQLIGSAADKLTITDDGLSLRLSKAEIPFFLSLAVGFADGYEIKEENPDGFALSLGNGLYIDHINLSIPLKDGAVDALRMEIAIGGRSRDGEALITCISMDCGFSDINSTIPGTIDMTGVALP